jgi:hypothetical protein
VRCRAGEVENLAILVFGSIMVIVARGCEPLIQNHLMLFFDFGEDHAGPHERAHMRDSAESFEGRSVVDDLNSDARSNARRIARHYLAPEQAQIPSTLLRLLA